MFKNTTGEYFNTYLDKVRIDKAKDFLKQGMKVYQVAEKVGYTNVDYFHSKFKKYVGTSPSNFPQGVGPVIYPCRNADSHNVTELWMRHRGHKAYYDQSIAWGIVGASARQIGYKQLRAV
ncbi:DNA-binding transcriptional regulator AraC [Actinobacillus pleuropneumoniae]|nr:DNA-binding transcriptional regulator AraC [Actinobacillus pleuropneumoniae]